MNYINNDFPVNPQDYTIILSNRSLKYIGQIVNVDYSTINAQFNLNSADQVTFTIYKELDGVIEPLWDKIIGLKIIYIVELNEFFQISVQLDDSSEQVSKTITATSLCEAELSQINLHGIEINTESDISRDDYVVTVFYDRDNPKGSLLHRILSVTQGNYSIGHVDFSLWRLQRSFSVDGVDIYSFLTGDCSEQFNCLFQFDSMTRTINVYDLYTVCQNTKCNYRGEFSDVCPECGSTNLSYFGSDTTIYIDKDNLTDDIAFSTDIDSVKNCFKIVGGDDNVTAAIRAVIPNGSDYIYYLSDEQKEDMSSTLVSKYDSYVKDCENAESEYITINENIYEALDKILYYTSEMMPTVENSGSKASDEAKKLTKAALSPMGLTAVTTSTSLVTVNSAIKNYAKIFIKTGYFKIEVDEKSSNSFSYVGSDSNGDHYGTWYGRFLITNYSDENDTAYSDYISVKVYDNYGTFLDQKIKKNISKNDTDDGSVYDVLSITDLTTFKKSLQLYCLNRLTSFRDAVQSVIDILVEEDQANPGADWYNNVYKPYYNKLKACEVEMNLRSKTINSWQQKHDDYVKKRTALQNKLNMETYLGSTLYKEFLLYRREDTYSNDNFISDGLSNSELLEKAKELVENAKNELFKSGERQYSISSTLDNLLVMKEFEPLVTNFKLGNWLRIKVDEQLYRLRLISYEINFGSLETLNVEFSDVTKTSAGLNDIASIKSQAQSLSTNFSYISKQAKQGEEAQKSIDVMLKEGFDASVVAIKNADSEDVVVGENGIRLRRYDDIYSAYDKEQAAFIHNMLVFTDDDWQTAKTALGKIKYTVDGVYKERYGLMAEAMISGEMVSGHIYSANYSSKNHTGTHINLETGEFSFAGGKLNYDGTTLRFSGIMSWNNIYDQPEIPDKTSQLTNDSSFTTMNDVEKKGYQNASQVTQITKDTVTTSYVNALSVKAGSVDAENITGTTITSKTFKSGTVEASTIKGGTINGTTITGANGNFTKGFDVSVPFEISSLGNLSAIMKLGITSTGSSWGVTIPKGEEDPAYGNYAANISISKGTMNIHAGSQLNLVGQGGVSIKSSYGTISIGDIDDIVGSLRGLVIWKNQKRDNLTQAAGTDDYWQFGDLCKISGYTRTVVNVSISGTMSSFMNHYQTENKDEGGIVIRTKNLSTAAFSGSIEVRCLYIRDGFH